MHDLTQGIKHSEEAGPCARLHRDTHRRGQLSSSWRCLIFCTCLLSQQSLQLIDCREKQWTYRPGWDSQGMHTLGYECPSKTTHQRVCPHLTSMRDKKLEVEPSENLGIWLVKQIIKLNLIIKLLNGGSLQVTGESGILPLLPLFLFLA